MNALQHAAPDPRPTRRATSVRTAGASGPPPPPPASHASWALLVDDGAGHPDERARVGIAKLTPRRLGGNVQRC
ncbi:hypothetical protein [Sorangium sp. So ce1153]|uniref:hypothetical protein n=1 Tax=Sorangium sp. So ce1153 TaxID=3133333 RepID=UPI003F6303F2